MKTAYIYLKVNELQADMYSKVNGLSKTKGRLLALPVAIIDVTLDTARSPLSAIEYLIMAAINLVGSLFSPKYSVKDALANAECSLASASLLPCKLIFAPAKVFYQIYAILSDPQIATNFNR